MLELFLPVPFHAFFGVAIMMSDALIVTDLRRTRRPVGASIRWPTRAWPAASSGRSASCRPSLVLAVVLLLLGELGGAARPARSTAPPTAPTTPSSRPTTPGLPAHWPSAGHRAAQRRRARRVASVGQVLLGRLDQHGGDQRAEHQQHRGPGEGRGVALDLRLAGATAGSGRVCASGDGVAVKQLVIAADRQRGQQRRADRGADLLGGVAAPRWPPRRRARRRRPAPGSTAARR